ncbi:hypothetical protein [Vibrio crassostreae]|uniref:hypothetical protein n=1 Tax=Vibrio crassostreae TaxID=246167 RepID=UPI001B307800|nr:hypothetical protein [Vibrio crassostreae]
MLNSKYIGASSYRIVGDCSSEEPKGFVGESYDDVANQISNALIESVWAEHCVYSIRELVGYINNHNDLVIYTRQNAEKVVSSTPFDIDEILSCEFLSGDYSTSDVQRVGLNMAELDELKDPIFLTLVDTYEELEGGHTVEKLPCENLFPVLAERYKEDNGDRLSLKGLFFSEPKIVIDEYADVYDLMFANVDDRQIEAAMSCVVSFEYKIAHNHGREVENEGNLIAFYASLVLKPSIYDSEIIEAFTKAAQ